MKNLWCGLGFHKEFAVEGFPLGSSNPIIVGVRCVRPSCRRVRCVNQAYRLTFDETTTKAFNEAREWLEKVTGKPVEGTFVHFR